MNIYTSDGALQIYNKMAEVKEQVFEAARMYLQNGEGLHPRWALNHLIPRRIEDFTSTHVTVLMSATSTDHYNTSVVLPIDFFDADNIEAWMANHCDTLRAAKARAEADAKSFVAEAERKKRHRAYLALASEFGEAVPKKPS